MPATSERPAAGRRLVFLHGFTQTHHHWHRCAHLIAGRCAAPTTLAFVDLPGHGLSGDDHTPIGRAGRAIAELAGRGTYVGYSMGGRFALHAALAGHAVERLVLIGATPGIADAAERAERRALDEARADRLEEVGVDAFLDEWLAAPLFATLPTDRTGREHRLANTAAGLAASLRSAGTGHQESLWDDLERIRVPVLVLAGEHDATFAAIGRQMSDRLPDATFALVPDAGHACHLEQPERTAAVIVSWLTGAAGRWSGDGQPIASPAANSAP